jgi:uncharacterized membrane-anchored protein
MLITRLARSFALVFLFLTVTAVAAAVPARKPAGKVPPPGSALPAATASAAPADGAPAEPAAATEQGPHWKPGPAQIDLGHDLSVDLPEPYVFLGMPEAAKLLEKIGSFHNESLLGLLSSKRDDSQWFITIRYEEEGFVKDDEKIDADELLKAIREGTEEANEERVSKGFSALHVGDWAEPPRYDKSVHHLVWALLANSDKGTSVNYNTRVLGRRGYVALNLVTDPESLSADKPHAAALLAATGFRAGARYEDFDGKKDKVAEYGLIGLVLGGAGLGAVKLVKVGLLAKFSKVILAALIAGKKAIVAFFVAAAALVKRLFSKKEAAKP